MTQFERSLNQSNGKLGFGVGPSPAGPTAIGEEIQAMRRRLRVTQRQFAGWFGFPTATLRNWERGTRHPTGAALVLLCVIRDNPRAVMKAVRKARLLAPGCLPEIEPLESYRAPPGFGDRPVPLRRHKKRRSKAFR